MRLPTKAKEGIVEGLELSLTSVMLCFYLPRCVARNPSGEDAATLSLHVTPPKISQSENYGSSQLKVVRIHPEVIVADIGSQAAFNCLISLQQPSQSKPFSFNTSSFHVEFYHMLIFSLIFC